MSNFKNTIRLTRETISGAVAVISLPERSSSATEVQLFFKHFHSPTRRPNATYGRISPSISYDINIWSRILRKCRCHDRYTHIRSRPSGRSATDGTVHTTCGGNTTIGLLPSQWSEWLRENNLSWQFATPLRTSEGLSIVFPRVINAELRAICSNNSVSTIYWIIRPEFYAVISRITYIYINVFKTT